MKVIRDTKIVWTWAAVVALGAPKDWDRLAKTSTGWAGKTFYFPMLLHLKIGSYLLPTLYMLSLIGLPIQFGHTLSFSTFLCSNFANFLLQHCHSHSLWLIPNESHNVKAISLFTKFQAFVAEIQVKHTLRHTVMTTVRSL